MSGHHVNEFGEEEEDQTAIAPPFDLSGDNQREFDVAVSAVATLADLQAGTPIEVPVDLSQMRTPAGNTLRHAVLLSAHVTHCFNEGNTAVALMGMRDANGRPVELSNSAVIAVARSQPVELASSASRAEQQFTDTVYAPFVAPVGVLQLPQPKVLLQMGEKQLQVVQRYGCATPQSFRRGLIVDGLGEPDVVLAAHDSPVAHLARKNGNVAGLEYDSDHPDNITTQHDSTGERRFQRLPVGLASKLISNAVKALTDTVPTRDLTRLTLCFQPVAAHATLAQQYPEVTEAAKLQLLGSKFRSMHMKLMLKVAATDPAVVNAVAPTHV